ncbi:hypothetical protein D3C86_1676260 [compost metagenome]
MHSEALQTKMVDGHYGYHLAGDNEAHHVGRTDIADNENNGDYIECTQHSAHKTGPRNLFEVGQRRDRVLIETGKCYGKDH